MSGVFGVIDPNHETDGVAALVRKMGQCLTYEDWHRVDHFTDDDQGVGLGRAAWGVFNSEPQPRRSRDGRFTVCFSGELFDDEALRRPLVRAERLVPNAPAGDLVLELYRDLGSGLLSHLNGTFALAVWDHREQELLLGTDRFGSYPIHFAHRRGRLLFAPQIKALLTDPALSARLDHVAVAEYLRFQHVLGERTFFEGISLLPNASSLHYAARSDTLRQRSYWDLSHLPELPAALSLEEAAEEAGRRLRDAVHMRTRGAHRVGVYLSGGIDSRALLGFGAERIAPIDTFTYGIPECRDVVYAQRLAQKLRTRHRYAPFRDGRWVIDYADRHLELTEGSHSWIHAHGISVVEQARQRIDVSLNGFRGGHLGIFWESPQVMTTADEASYSSGLFSILTHTATWPSLDEGETHLLLRSEFGRPLRGLAFESLQRELCRFAHMTPERRAAAFDIANPGRRFYQCSLMFHRAHIEQRIPFCDYAYTEFVYALPAHLLMGRELRRAILRRYLPRLCSVPYDRDDLPIGRNEWWRAAARLRRRATSLFNRTLMPLFPRRETLNADYEGWLRNDLRVWGEDLLLGPRTRQRGLFDPKAVAGLWNRQLARDTVNHIGKIAPLMTLELLLRRYFDS